MSRKKINDILDMMGKKWDDTPLPQPIVEKYADPVPATPPKYPPITPPPQMTEPAKTELTPEDDFNFEPPAEKLVRVKAAMEVPADAKAGEATPEEDFDGRTRLPPLKDVDQGAILALLDAISNFDPIVIQDSYTGASNLSELTLEQRMCIRSVKIREEKEKGVKVGQVVEITFWDKLSALEMLGKFKKMFADKEVTNNTIIITDRLRRAEARLKDVGPKDSN